MAKAQNNSEDDPLRVFRDMKEATKRNAMLTEGQKAQRIKSLDILCHILDEITLVVPDYFSYLLFQVSATYPHQVSYKLINECPSEKGEKIKKIIFDNATLLNLLVTTEGIE